MAAAANEQLTPSDEELTLEQEESVETTASSKKDNLRWWILLTVIIGTFLGRLDQTIANLALPKIIIEFGITVSSAGWIATAYILANAIFVPIWGKLGDTIGRRKVYVLGLVIFIIGSVLVAFSWNFSSMIFFRVIQAIAGSADYPTAMAILAVTFRQGKERAQALGIWSVSFAAASVFGPLIGGPLIDNFGWRSIFLINLPLGLIGLGMVLLFVRESVSGNTDKHFDWWGAITLGISLSALVLVLDKGLTWGWGSVSSLLCYLATTLFMFIFIKIERDNPAAIVDLKFFKNSVFVNTLFNNFIVFMGLIGCIFLLPIFAQTFLGFSATETGYLFIPMSLMMVIASPLGGSLTGRVPARYVICASTLVTALGLYFFTHLDPRSTPWDIIWPLMIMAFGLGFGMAQRTNIIASIVPEKEIGVASSVLALGRNIAGAFGIAIFGTILSTSIGGKIMSISQQSVIRVPSLAVEKTVAALIILKAQVAAYAHVFVIAALVVFIGGLLALQIKVGEEKNIKVNVE